MLLPVYNGARFLRGAIESVLEQEGCEFELLVCDDASTDESLMLVQSYRSPRLRVLCNTSNQGLFPTLNRLIRESSGSLVRLWAQDDVMLSGCLESEVAFHRRFPDITMSYCARQVIGANGAAIGGIEPDDTPEIVAPRLAAQISFYHGSMPGNIATVAIKRSALDEVGLFREDMHVSGDFEMWVRLSKTHPIGFINAPLIKLRAHAWQFSREQGIGVEFIKEDREIIEVLLDRLPEEMKGFARSYNRRHRLTMYFHYMVKCLVEGDFSRVAEVWSEIARFDNPLAVGAFWIVSANGRLWRPTPRYVV